ncbi:histidinol-phosphatase, inositol monophosphatase family [Limimonas halophila]|uniref:Histidinol-phosphatase, inositol monophosphatase family n=1 Tax=Limimonas halophila TaxID=1082479 RepID=A0A1G7U9Z4_9PROT|nr:inositol monophosphatase family protein [Limimonas halophila]SDG44101.1 histidinol-phosphatase, inositol monophosphatase family [Limimonas halophila]
MSVPGAFVELAERLADTAREHLRPHHRTALEVQRKADGTPVTEPEQATERALRAIIHEAYPDHGIVGEEGGAERIDAEYVWMLDPIDGTKQFLTGKPGFSSLIALLHQGQPVLGIIEVPAMQERWLGVRDRGTRHTDVNGTRFAQTRRCDSLDQARFATTVPTGDDEESADAFLRLAESVQLAVSGGDGHNYGLLASGFCDIVLDATMSAYDYAALVPIVAEAGGAISDSNGEPLGGEGERTVVASGSPALHEQVLNVLAGAS